MTGDVRAILRGGLTAMGLMPQDHECPDPERGEQRQQGNQVPQWDHSLPAIQPDFLAVVLVVHGTQYALPGRSQGALETMPVLSWPDQRGRFRRPQRGAGTWALDGGRSSSGEEGRFLEYDRAGRRWGGF